MSRSNKERTKHKDDKQIDPLFKRWQEEPFRSMLKHIKEEKRISRKAPKYEGKHDLRYANFRKTRLYDVVMSNSCMDSIVAYNLYLSHSNLSECKIYKGDFEESNLTDSNFDKCEFRNSSFRNAYLSNITMKDSVFYNCLFDGAELDNLSVENAVFEKTDFGKLVNPTNLIISGEPKSLKDSIIDKYSILLMPESAFKKKFLEEGIILDNKSGKEYDVALSFAGENREYVERVANYLKTSGVSVFYDNFETHELWGKELVTYLTELYSERCNYVIIFASKYYNSKSWPNVERIASLSRILSGEYDNILPVKMDNILTKGLTHSKGYLDGTVFTPEEVAETFIRKLISELEK